MSITLEAHGPVSEQDAGDVERRLGVRLPPAYRAWLLAFGGGVLSDYAVVPGTGGNGVIDQFEAVEDLVGTQAFEPNKLVPPGYVVIAVGSGGSLAIRTADDDYGSLWWADFDKADAIDLAGDTPEGPTPGIMARLADDFPSLLVLLDIV
ncbi:hypothetical protein ABH920_006070 [Catenulispora sp. EB89]|uniref:SMI1/KNR4 family protein n=1 Tax=Catenulispora sp. EB89 TaxID=3156257 RepID=UPI003519ABBC